MCHAKGQTMPRETAEWKHEPRDKENRPHPWQAKAHSLCYASQPCEKIQSQHEHHRQTNCNTYMSIKIQGKAYQDTGKGKHCN